MHIPDGFLDTKTSLAALAVAGAALTCVTRRVKQQFSDRTIPLLGVMSAFLFAAQMVNFPISGATSGHLFGGVLAAVLLGPAGAMLVTGTVLLVQCILFQDGGLLAFGANFFNLAVVGIGGGYGVFRLLTRWDSSQSNIPSAAALAGWFSLPLASAACAMEIAWSGAADLSLVLPPLLSVHALIGVAEGFITASILSFVIKVRPELVPAAAACSLDSPALHRYAAYGLALALAVALCLAPFASTLPDGFEFVVSQLHSGGHIDTAYAAPFAEYSFPGVTATWLATSLVGGFGTAFAFGFMKMVLRCLRRPRL